MSKAFSEDEKLNIKHKMMEVAIEIFHESGTKGLSIKELTKRAGIAQGSFYNFWKDKDALIMDVMQYRLSQKLEIAKQSFDESLENPVKFLVDIIYEHSIDLKEKYKKKPIYAQALNMLSKKNENRIYEANSLYTDFINKLAEYWKEQNAVKDVDEKGLINAFTGSFLLFSNYYKFEEEYFNDILKVFISAVVKRYIEL
nr:TetR/AcrR family transcriptional regulator [uncultured Lachnoanaerobaculum sp.]